MEIIDCFWEQANIGKKTIEFVFGADESYDSEKVKQMVTEYEYSVAKVHCGNISCLLGLQADGFILIETQIGLSKKIADFRFDDKMVRFVDKRVNYHTITNEKEMHSVLDSITENMFSTDRIYLDPSLGPKLSLRRYHNWIESEFRKGAILYESELKGERVGFGLFKLNDTTMNVLLGGIYERYQNNGIGILTACGPILFSKSHDLNPYQEITSVSSNNFPVLQFYNYLDFTISKMSYVLVKHLD